MKIAPIFDPEKRREGPKPARVDLKRVFNLGLLVWCIATVIVLLCSYFKGALLLTSLGVCLSGLLVGCMLLVWEHFNRSHYMKLANGSEDNSAEYSSSLPSSK
ncbi:MAG: DUF2530 domain-containing protein [Aeriscardovia sp.]|nr:DUF2530 domain-containing protein [Aeriscardovia sp.]